VLFLIYAHSSIGLLTASPHVGEAVCLLNGNFNFTAVDFLSPKDVTWHLAGKDVTEKNIVEDVEHLMKIAGEMDIPRYISPQYFFRPL